MDIKIAVHHNGQVAHVLDLAQEGEGFWPEFLQEMSNAGHGEDTICRTIVERLKATVHPVLTQPPGAAIGVNALHDAIDQFFTYEKTRMAEAMERYASEMRDVMHEELARVTQKAATVEASNDNGGKPEPDAQSAGA